MSAVFLLLAACRLFSADHDLVYPQASLSADWNQPIDLGAIDVDSETTVTIKLTNPGMLDLGVWEIALRSGDEFSADYDLDEAYCEDGSEGATALEEGFLLHGGCTLPLQLSFHPTTAGERADHLSVVTFEDDASPPAFFADRRDPIAQIALIGYGQAGVLALEPRSLRFGHVAEGETAIEYITVENIGDGPLQLGAPELDCDAEYALNTDLFSDDLLAGESTLLAVEYTSQSSASSQCLLHISDEQAQSQQVFLQGNLEAENNTPPTLNLIRPALGSFYDGYKPLQLELQIMDPDQDAATLSCDVRSIWQDAGIIADCTPTDKTGHVIISIEGEMLEAGVDTLEVTVTDMAEASTKASTTVAWRTTSADDDDGDGFGDDIDCDDTEAAAYPGATEQWDDIDNDCDGLIDEDTEGSDDDGDSISEDGGDCNDSDASIYPGAPEVADQQDNDCDGETDEGTVLVDDDRDGYSPFLGDCNDSNDALHPSAVELCDGVDNNCDGHVDNDCIQTDAEPEIIACMHDESALSLGERVVLAVSFIDEEVSPTITWSLDDELGALTNPNGSTTAWIAPDALAGDQETVTVTVTVTDSLGQSDSCSDTLTLYAAPLPATAREREIRRADGCAGGSAAALLLPLSLVGMRRRRSRTPHIDTASLRKV